MVGRKPKTVPLAGKMNLLKSSITDLMSEEELEQLSKIDKDGKFLRLLRYVDTGVHHTRACMLAGYADDYTNDMLSKTDCGTDHYIRRSLLLRAERLRIARLEQLLLYNYIDSEKMTPKVIMEILTRLSPDTWGLVSDINVNLNKSVAEETVEIVNNAMQSLNDAENSGKQ